MIACLRGQEAHNDGDDAMVICAGGPDGAHRSALRALGGHTEEGPSQKPGTLNREL